MISLQYPAKFSREDGGAYTVTFRDVPEAVTCGDDLTDARMMAIDALATAVEFYLERNCTLPYPSELQDGEEWIDLIVGDDVAVPQLY